jgi:hypothetical protein
VGFRDRRLEARNGEKPTVRSSVKPSHAVNNNLINQTRAVWQPRLGRDLSNEDARQIAENVTGTTPARRQRAIAPGVGSGRAAAYELPARRKRWISTIS